MNKKDILIVVLVIVIIAGAVIAFIGHSKPNTAPQPQLDAFAQCIASKNITMYGAAWCPHCQAQKALFGASFKYIPYVECPANAALCLAKNIQGYPTWITASGTPYEGEQSLENIAQISGCALATSTN